MGTTMSVECIMRQIWPGIRNSQNTRRNGRRNATLNIHLGDTGVRRPAGCLCYRGCLCFTENLAAGTGDYTVTDGINAWANEAKDYDYSNPVFSDITGHFTQLVWRNTSDIGCAMVDCAPGTIFSAVRIPRSLLPIDLTCECRVGVSLPCVRVLLTRQCHRSICVRLLSPFYQEWKLTWIFFLFLQRECPSIRPTSILPRIIYIYCAGEQVSSTHLSSYFDGRR